MSKQCNTWGAATARAKTAGYDGIMIHGGSGYLVGEFLSPLTNKRNDSYGGSVERRARFAVELMRSAKESGGRDFVIIFRLGCDEHIPGGFAIQEATIVAQVLEEAGADAIGVVSGGIAHDEWVVPPAALPLACNTDLSLAIRRKVAIPVMVAGRITSPELAERVLAEGKADFIDLGRELIADPCFPQKAAEDRAEDIVPCIGCINCDTRPTNKPVTCTVNLAVGKEKEFAIKPVTSPKSVLVIGGGPGGMEAALVAALRGHRVALWEKATQLGGQLNQAAIPPHKVELGILKDYLSTQLRKAGVMVELEKEATLEAVKRFEPDVVVVATGSRPLIPEIPGIGQSGAVDAREALTRGVEGDHVVVIGGELVGCETAEFLADQGKKVTVVRRGKEMATDVPRSARKLLLPRLEAKGVKLLPMIQYDKISDQGVSVIHPDGTKEVLEADTVVLATGSVAENDLFFALKDMVREVYHIGDCYEPRKLKDAIHEGAKVAWDI
ncbi:FAD-dependent oxidoreductase [Chloroflexota bacterium]